MQKKKIGVHLYKSVENKQTTQKKKIVVNLFKSVENKQTNNAKYKRSL